MIYKIIFLLGIIMLIQIFYLIINSNFVVKSVTQQNKLDHIPLENIINNLRIYHVDQSYKFNLTNLPTKTINPNNSNLSTYEHILIEGIKNDVSLWKQYIRNSCAHIKLLINDVKLSFINYTEEEAIIYCSVYLTVNNDKMVIDAKYYVKIYKGNTLSEEDEYNYQLFDVRTHRESKGFIPNPFPTMKELEHASKFF